MRGAVFQLPSIVSVTTGRSGFRPTRAEVDLAAVRCNFAVLSKWVGVPIWGVVKADAYGHGAVEVARALQAVGARGLCVALMEEAMELRDSGLTLPILVMADTATTDAQLFHRQGLIPVITNVEQVRALARSARSLPRPLAVHVKLDTGMSRLGCAPGEWGSLLEALRAGSVLEPTGLMTHLATADCEPCTVSEQLSRFSKGLELWRSLGLARPQLHAANTAGAVAHPDARFDLVRVGIGLYGHVPGIAHAPELKAALRLRTEVVALRWLKSGDSVGYGGTWRAQRRSRIATLPLGYADGLSRALSNRGHVLIRGQLAPIVGVVSMDLTTVDVTDLEGVVVGDEAVALGAQTGPLGRGLIAATTVAKQSGTIAWEVMTSVSHRVPRHFSG